MFLSGGHACEVAAGRPIGAGCPLRCWRRALSSSDAVESVTVVDDGPDITADEVIMEDAAAANDTDIDDADDATDGETHE